MRQPVVQLKILIEKLEMQYIFFMSFLHVSILICAIKATEMFCNKMQI